MDPAAVHCLAFSKGDHPDWLAMSSDKVQPQLCEVAQIRSLAARSS